MQIVIDIDEEIYNHMKKRFMYGYVNTELDKIGLAVSNGIPLPKGHGRLIDADKLNRKNVNCANVPMNFIDIAPTIIEAEGGDSE